MSYDAEHSALPLRIRELPIAARPVYRLHDAGPAALSDAELLAILIQATTLDYAQQLLVQFDGWRGLLQATSAELQRTLGIGPIARRRSARH